MGKTSLSKVAKRLVLISVIVIFILSFIVNIQTLPLDNLIFKSTSLGRFINFELQSRLLINENVSSQIFEYSNIEDNRTNNITRIEKDFFIRYLDKTLLVKASMLPRKDDNNYKLAGYTENPFSSCTLSFIDEPGIIAFCLAYPIPSLTEADTYLLYINKDLIFDSPFSDQIEGIYKIDVSSDDMEAEKLDIELPTDFFSGTDILVSPDGRFLEYYENNMLTVFNLETQEKFSMAINTDGIEKNTYSEYIVNYEQWSSNNQISLTLAKSVDLNRNDILCLSVNAVNMTIMSSQYYENAYISKDYRAAIICDDRLTVINMIDFSIKSIDLPENYDLSDSEFYCSPNGNIIAAKDYYEEKIFFADMISQKSKMFSSIMNKKIWSATSIDILGFYDNDKLILGNKLRYDIEVYLTDINAVFELEYN